MIRLLAPTLLLFTLLCTCAPAERDLRDYYFPTRELVKEGQVYAYQMSGSLPGPDFDHTYYVGVDLDTALHLSVTRFGTDGEPLQQSQQRIRNDGAYLESMILAQADSNGRQALVQADVLFDKVFDFYHREETPTAAGFRLGFNAPATPDVRQFVTLNRYFAGDTTVTVMGETYDAIVIRTAGEVSLRDPQDGDISPQYTGREIYARGLGMVEYERDLGAAGNMVGKLTELITMPDFIKQNDPHAGHNH